MGDALHPNEQKRQLKP